MPRSVGEIAQAHLDRAAENRAHMPECAAAKALFISLFGPAVRMTYAEENGRTVGRRDTQAWVSFSLPHAGPKKKPAQRRRD